MKRQVSFPKKFFQPQGHNGFASSIQFDIESLKSRDNISIRKISSKSPVKIEGKSLMPYFKTIELSDMKLKNIPLEVNLFKDAMVVSDYAKMMDLSKNKICFVPSEIGKDHCLRTLDTLNLSENRIANLSPLFFENLNSLVTLNLDFNLLEEIPVNILHLNRLANLSIVGNRIKSLRKWILKLTAEFKFEWQLYCNRTVNLSSIGKPK